MGPKGQRAARESSSPTRRRILDPAIAQDLNPAIAQDLNPAIGQRYETHAFGVKASLLVFS